MSDVWSVRYDPGPASIRTVVIMAVVCALAGMAIALLAGVP